MNESTEKNVPILLWPFFALWRLLTFILGVIGRVLCAVLGVALMVAGVVITMSVVGAPVGIPLAALGFLFLARSIF